VNVKILLEDTGVFIIVHQQHPADNINYACLSCINLAFSQRVGNDRSGIATEHKVVAGVYAVRTGRPCARQPH
jgi:hypothetical protein